MIKYPDPIVNYGAKYRRTKYKYIDLPKLQADLNNAEILLKAYLDFVKIAHPYIDISELFDIIKALYSAAWLQYYGIDAKENLVYYYKKDELQWAVDSLNQEQPQS